MSDWMVRHASEEDRAVLIAMAQRFLSIDGPYGTRFHVDVEKVDALVSQILRADGAALALIAAHDGDPVGMFGMFLLDHPITGEKVAAELCWWMEPEFRGTRLPFRMLQQAEAWAKARQATVIEMIAPSPRVEAFYQRIGYDRTDVHYRKTL